MSDRSSILFVFCDNHLAGIYATKFEQDGWDVDIAETLEEGERKAAKLRPDVIVLDASCAVDISKEVKRMRALPTLQRVKIAIFATVGDRQEIQDSLKAGAKTYLVKGQFIPQEMVAKMRNLLE